MLGHARQPPEEEIPPVYLLPYLRRERVEPPSSERAPRSDLDRRAHGGEGNPSDTPGMRGNMFEPRLEPPSPGGGVPQGAPPTAGGTQVPPAAESPEERTAPKAEGADQRGADAVLHVPEAAQPQGQPMLKGLSSAGQGIGGSGSRPDRRGGQVDLGPLSCYTIPAAGGTTRTNEEGQRLEFELLYPDEPAYQPLAEMIAEKWSELGVDATLKPVSYDDLVSAYLEPRAYQAALVELNLSRYPDPDPYPFWHQAQITGGQNYAKWDDRQASEYLEQARIETDVAEHARLYRNFQVRFASELPALPLFYPVYNYAVDQLVQGITVGPLFDPSDRFATVTNWFLTTTSGLGGETTPAEISPTP